MVVAEGESIKGEILQTGNTNTRCSFHRGVAEFMERWCAAGPTHHFDLGVCHIGVQIKRVVNVLGMELEII